MRGHEIAEVHAAAIRVLVQAQANLLLHGLSVEVLVDAAVTAARVARPAEPEAYTVPECASSQNQFTGTETLFVAAKARRHLRLVAGP